MKLLKCFLIIACFFSFAPQTLAGLNPEGSSFKSVNQVTKETDGSSFEVEVEIHNEGFKPITAIDFSIDTCDQCQDPLTLASVSGDYEKSDFDKENDIYSLQNITLEAETTKSFTLHFEFANGGTSTYSLSLQGSPTDPSIGLSLEVSGPGDHHTKIGGFLLSDVFSDLSETSDYLDAILWMYKNAVIAGYPDGQFKPDRCVNRAEFLKMMFETKAQDTSSDYNTQFSDIDKSQWYYPYITNAYSLEIIEGYPDKTFKPDQCVTRAEAIKMAIEGMNIDLSNGIVENYIDIQGQDWYFDYINTAIAKNIIGTKHVQNFIFGANEGMSRKEVAEMLYRIHSINNNSRDKYTPTLIPSDIERKFGTIEGSLSFPSEALPDELLACAQNLDSGHTYCTNQRITNDKYHYGIGYLLKVPIGNYHAFSKLEEEKFYFTEFMSCGVKVTCDSHAIINIEVKEGEKYFDAYLGDYYISQEMQTSSQFNIPTADDDAVLGSPNAPITIIVFSDYACPYCQLFVQKTLPQLKEDYIDTNKVKFIYRDFPLYLQGERAAIAAECARDQGSDVTYFQYHDLVFAGTEISDELLEDYAKELSLNLTEFNQCLSSEKFLPEVLADKADGEEAQINGTPTFFINGKTILGAQPYEVFQAEIEKEL